MSGDLLLGPFDSEASLDSFFDPCVDITDEEFEAAGLRKGGKDEAASSETDGFNFCKIDTGDSFMESGVGMSAATLADVTQNSGPVSGLTSTLLPDGKAVNLPGENNMCFFGVETNR